MPYGWHNEASLIATHHWLEFNSFKTVFRSFRFKQFSLKSHRDEMMVTLANLPVYLPFAIDKRFPDDGIFIDLDHSLVSRMIAQLTMALDFADRQTEKGRAVPDNIDTRIYSNMEDAKVSFYNVIRSLLDISGPVPVESAHVFGVYVRTSFEREFSLTWS